MQRRLFVRGLAWAVGILVVSGTLARAEGLPRDFVSAYASALQTIRQVYSAGTIEGTVKQENAQSGQVSNKSFILRIINTWVRLDSTIDNPPSAVTPTGGTRVILATPDASLQTFQSPGARMFDASSLVQDDYVEAKTRISDLIPLNYAYSFNNQNTILDMLQSGGVRIVRFQRVKLKGERFYRIDYEQPVDPDGRFGPWKCTLLISPDEGFALREYSRTTGSGSHQVTYAGSLKYNLNSNGVPLVSMIDRRQLHGATVVDRSVVTISEFDTEPPRKIYFRADSM